MQLLPAEGQVEARPAVGNPAVVDDRGAHRSGEDEADAQTDAQAVERDVAGAIPDVARADPRVDASQ